MVGARVWTVARHEKWRAPLDNCEHVTTQASEISANVKSSANMHLLRSFPVKMRKCSS